MNLDQRLRVSPAFSFAVMPDGRPYVAQEVEPYLQYWVTDRERQLWTAFAARGGATPAEVTAPETAAERLRRNRAIAAMLKAGVLVPLRDDSSRYDKAIVGPYLEHRPFPPEIAAQIIQRGGLGRGGRVIDLAGGPGDLALQLAASGADVSLMDWSGAFLAVARRHAKAQGVALRTVHDSCNRLMHDDGSYDVVTVSQALHWLDDVAVCRGVLRVLREGGSFFVVHSAFDVPARHPLAHVLGADSVLGAKVRQPFAREVQALHNRVQLLLRALDTRGVERFDPTHRRQSLAPLRSAGMARFRQRRPLGMGFLRGLLTPRHLQLAGLDEASFWDDVESRCRHARAAELLGTHDWALLHFQRGPARTVKPVASRCPVQAIGCGAPAED